VSPCYQPYSYEHPYVFSCHLFAMSKVSLKIYDANIFLYCDNEDARSSFIFANHYGTVSADPHHLFKYSPSY
jgi:hypothetical protein